MSTKQNGKSKEWLVVKNWGKFQHYKDRNPPWIKLHNSLLTDYEFSQLSRGLRCLLIQLWLVASRFDGMVPQSVEELHFLLHDPTIEASEIDHLIEAGFLIVPNDSAMLYREEKRRDREENKKTSFRNSSFPLTKKDSPFYDSNGEFKEYE